MRKIVLFLCVLSIITGYYCLGISDSKLLYEVSAGASIVEIPDTVIYTDVEHIVFTIPSLPKLKPLQGKRCEGQDYCAVVNQNHELNSASFNLSEVMARMFTVVGMQGKSFQGEDWPLNLYDTKAQTSTILDMKNVVQEAEREWFTHMNNVRQKYPGRQKRAFPLMLIAKPLISIMRNLFNNKASIVRSLVQNIGKESNPLSIVSSISEFALSSIENAKKFKAASEKITNIKSEYFNAAPMVEKEWRVKLFMAIYDTNVVLSDLVYLSHFSQIFAIHAQAVSSCRANEIPVSYVPPAMLYDRLLNLEKKLHPDMELAIPPSQIMTYYKMDNADCTFGDDAGLVVIEIPIRPVGMNYQLFRFRGISFAFGGGTCNFELPTTYVVKESGSNTIFPITDVDEEHCNPTKTGKCLVPPINSGGSSGHLCMEAIMREDSATTIKGICTSNCRNESQLRVFQPRPNTVFLTNPPATGLSVTCKNSNDVIDVDVDIGALQITLNCNCHLLLNAATLAKSSSSPCVNGYGPPAFLNKLIPIQWLDGNGPSVGAVIETIDDVLDPKWAGEDNSDLSITNWVGDQANKISWITTLGQIGQSLVIMVLYLRTNGIGAAIPIILDRLRRVEAAPEVVVCDLPFTTELLLYVTTFLVVLNLMYSILRHALAKLRNAWRGAVERAVAIREIDVSA